MERQKRKVEIPNGWNGVTIRMYQKFQEVKAKGLKKDDFNLEMLGVICGIDKEMIERLEIKSLNKKHKFTNLISMDILEALKDPVDYENIIEIEDWIETQNLRNNEKLFIRLRLDGFTMEEISEDIGESAYKVRQSLREKFSDIANEHQKPI